MPTGTTMSLDISTLYLVATLVATLLGAMLLFFWRQEKIEALGWWGAAYILGAASIVQANEPSSRGRVIEKYTGIERISVVTSSVSRMNCT